MLNNNNFITILTFNRENPELAPDFNKKYFKTYRSVGLCNQLFSIINPILNSNNNFFIIDSFFLGNSSRKCAPISKIIDLERTSYKMSIILNRPIYLLDRNNLNIEFISIFYGNNNRKIDITDKFIDYFKKNGSIKTDISLNDLFTDPIANQSKELYIVYRIDDYMIQEILPENKTKLMEELSFNKDILNKKWDKSCRNFGWYDKNPSLFNNLLNSITFFKKIYELVDSLSIPFKNTIHLRIEGDSIEFWSKQNKISEKAFYLFLIDKYKRHITENIDKNENLLILSGVSEDHDFIKKLQENYNVTIVDKSKLLKDFEYNGNELNAIIDLILGFKTTDLFIGCHNMDKKRGSTFTYTILNKLKNVKKYMIDLDSIKT